MTRLESTSPQGAVDARPTYRPGRWIDHWEPEDPAFWARIGKRHTWVSV